MLAGFLTRPLHRSLNLMAAAAYGSPASARAGSGPCGSSDMPLQRACSSSSLLRPRGQPTSIDDIASVVVDVSGRFRQALSRTNEKANIRTNTRTIWRRHQQRRGESSSLDVSCTKTCGRAPLPGLRRMRSVKCSQFSVVPGRKIDRWACLLKSEFLITYKELDTRVVAS